jgi:antitoxin YefM
VRQKPPLKLKDIWTIRPHPAKQISKSLTITPFSMYVLTYVRFGVHLAYLHKLEVIMAGITATEARSNLYRLIDETAESHQPIVITGKRHSAVLVSEEDWSAIQETLYLLSVPGMRESIREGMDTPVDQCDQELDW